MTPARRSATDATIARLKVRADRADPVTARLGVERILGAIELRPGSLPPSAILCVRELRDPRPGTISLESRELRPPPVWEQALQREVDRLARAATRPAHGAAPAAAEAVVFADEAELLACLGSDLVAGVVASRWWWRLLVEGVEQPRRATVMAWLRAPEHAPAALHALAERGQAAAFVCILDDREARSLADAIAKRFALPMMVPIVEAVHPSSPATALGAQVRALVAPWATVAPETKQSGLSTERSAPVAPWATVAPEAEQAGLSTEQRALVGVALTIARAPSLARSTDFVTALAAWRIADASPQLSDGALAAQRASQIAPMSLPARATPTRPPDGTAEQGLSWPVDAAPQSEVTAAGSSRVGILASPPAAAVGDAMPPRIAQSAPAAPPPSPLPSPTITETTAPATAAWRTDEAGAIPERLLAAAPTEPGAVVETTRWSAPSPQTLLSLRPRSRAFGPPIATGLGGLFYLVNLALYLRLYGDSDDDNLPLPLWDFIALVGRALLGDAASADDPVWSLLAELAGRAADEPPGAGFVPPADWRLPPAWLAPFDAAPARYGTSDSRLVIAHAEGFLLVDVEAHGDRDEQLASELAPYGELPCAPSTDDAPLAPPAGPALESWLARLVPYVRARLRGVLAVDDEELPTLLLTHRARVHVTDTHLDIALSLETLPVELRFAGLDRDPGWVAAAGRFIAFHFE